MKHIDVWMGMRKTVLALIVVLIVVSLVGLVAFYPAPSSGSWHGFGVHSGQGTQTDYTVWILVVAVPLVVALGLVVYEVLFSRTKLEPAQHNAPASPAQPVAVEPAETQTATIAEPTETPQALDAILRVLNEDERKVVQAIAASEEGFILQRDLRWKTGLTKVQTHRVLARLSARGIVKVEKYYNTNKVVLADWASSQ